MYLLIWIKKNKINKHGTCPIILRVTIDGLRWNTSTGLRINPSEWNNETKSTTSQIINKKLTQRENEMIQIASNLRLQGKLCIAELKRYFAPVKATKKINVIDILNNYRKNKLKKVQIVILKDITRMLHVLY